MRKRRPVAKKKRRAKPAEPPTDAEAYGGGGYDYEGGGRGSVTDVEMSPAVVGSSPVDAGAGDDSSPPKDLLVSDFVAADDGVVPFPRPEGIVEVHFFPVGTLSEFQLVYGS